MYAANTILSLKTQRDPDPETGEEFAYNKVKVVGPSPINHGTADGWSGMQATGVIITPLTNFGSTLDEPLGKLQALYDIEEEPKVEVEVAKIRVIDSASRDAGETPEEVFAREAPGEADAEGGRKRTPFVSPLEDPRPQGDGGGPLGIVHPEGRVTDTGQPSPVVNE